MSGLTNLIEKISADCSEEAGRIIDAAKAEADEIRAKAEKSAEVEKERILSSADAEAKRLYNQLIINKRLELRDRQLAERRAVIDGIYDIALDSLNKLSDDGFGEFLRVGLVSLDFQSGELILPDNYSVDVDALNAFLSENGKGRVTLYAGSRKISGGFVLIEDGVEYNNTFEAILAYRRDVLDVDILRHLA
jgi:Archaeal/vacuolar-type H+-ATPase subunit E